MPFGNEEKKGRSKISNGRGNYLKCPNLFEIYLYFWCMFYPVRNIFFLKIAAVKQFSPKRMSLQSQRKKHLITELLANVNQSPVILMILIHSKI